MVRLNLVINVGIRVILTHSQPFQGSTDTVYHTTNYSGVLTVMLMVRVRDNNIFGEKKNPKRISYFFFCEVGTS